MTELYHLIPRSYASYTQKVSLNSLPNLPTKCKSSSVEGDTNLPPARSSESPIGIDSEGLLVTQSPL